MPVRESVRFLITLLLVFLALVILLFAGFAAPIVFGTLLAGITYPVYRWLFRQTGGRENVAAFITVLAITILILLPATSILTLLTREAFQLFSANREQFLPTSPFIARLADITAHFGFDLVSFLNTTLAPALRNLGSTIVGEIGGILGNALRLGLNFFLMIVTAFYMLRDGKAFGKFLINLSPLPNTDDFTIYRTFRNTGLAVLVGIFVAALLQGLLGGIGFFVFGIPSPVLWGTVMAFLGLLPFIGPYLIFLPAAAYLFLSGHPIATLLFLLYNLLIVSTVDNIVRPTLLSERMHIHPLLILFGIFGGLKVFGIIGIIYGPLIMAMFLALLHVYLAHMKGQKTHASA